MSDTERTSPAGSSSPVTRPAPETYPTRGREEPTGWVGWVFFAGMMMILLGAFQAIEGFVALFKDTYYLVPAKNLVVNVNYTTWGWVHLAIGLVVLATGFGVMAGQMWARVLGIVVAGVSAIVNVAFIGAYPIWSLMVITLDVIVIYALAVHGREVKY